jgi:hypothetical protein
MGSLLVSNRVIMRDSFGRFIAECKQAGPKTVKDMVQDGAKLSRQMAPVGRDHDTRSIPIKQSINYRVAGTTGYWFATARHALFQELGAGPHLILGSPFLQFFWEAEGRMWVPGAMGPQDVVNHPGNPPQPFLRPAYEVIMARWARYADRHYPG